MNEQREISGKPLRGFTLIELLVVLMILGLLAGLVGPRVMKYLGGAKTDTAQLQIEEFGTGLDLYHLEVGRYPTTEQGLQALAEQPVDASNWHGPYLKKKDVPPKIRYNHDRYMICTAPSRSHPAFSGRECGGDLKAEQTKHGGRVKIWVCPKCNKRIPTEGRPV